MSRVSLKRFPVNLAADGTGLGFDSPQNAHQPECRRAPLVEPRARHGAKQMPSFEILHQTKPKYETRGSCALKYLQITAKAI
jgi:hypothetical protein